MGMEILILMVCLLMYFVIDFECEDKEYILFVFYIEFKTLMEQDQILGFNGLQNANSASGSGSNASSNADEMKQNDEDNTKKKRRKRKGKTKDY